MREETLEQLNPGLTFEKKERLLLKLCLKSTDVSELTGLSLKRSRELMDICKSQFKGQCGIRVSEITPRSLCEALGTSLEEELKMIAIARNKRITGFNFNDKEK